MKISEEQARRTAAIVDVNCWFRWGKRVNFTLTLMFRRPEKEDLKFLHDVFGGRLTEIPQPDGQVFYWYSLQTRVEVLLNAIRPFIQGRSREVELCFEYYASMVAYRKRKMKGKPLAEDEVQRRTSIAQRVVDLNLEWYQLNDPTALTRREINAKRRKAMS